LKYAVANPEVITNMYSAFLEPGDCEVFTKSAWFYVGSVESLRPVGLVVCGKSVDGFTFTTMIFEVCLPVSV
jgi:hypothetical protein